MNNKTPFSILDAYSDETYHLYNVLRAFTNYPRIEQDGYEDAEGKLYSLAFVYLVQDYLSVTIDIYQFDDWEGLVSDMELDQDRIEILANYPQSEDSYDEHLWEVKEIYKKKIITDLKELYPTTSLLMKFFAAIFHLADDDYMPSLTLDVLGFFDEL